MKIILENNIKKNDVLTTLRLEFMYRQYMSTNITYKVGNITKNEMQKSVQKSTGKNPLEIRMSRSDKSNT